MTTKTRRRIAAWLGILGVAFAQVVAPVYASAPHTSAGAGSFAAGAVGGDEPVDGRGALRPCNGLGAGAVPPANNLCEVHCNDGVTKAPALDLPQVALAPLPIPAIRPAALVDARAAALPSGVRLTAAPPLIVQFGRLLI